MKPTDKNTYAFPLKEPLSNDELGMTLRDYFAAKAMEALISDGRNAGLKIIASDAYQIADAMLAERVK